MWRVFFIEYRSAFCDCHCHAATATLTNFRPMSCVVHPERVRLLSGPPVHLVLLPWYSSRLSSESSAALPSSCACRFALFLAQSASVFASGHRVTTKRHTAFDSSFLMSRGGRYVPENAFCPAALSPLVPYSPAVIHRRRTEPSGGCVGCHSRHRRCMADHAGRLVRELNWRLMNGVI